MEEEEEGEFGDTWQPEDRREPGAEDAFYVHADDVLPKGAPDPVGPLLVPTADKSLIPARKPTRVAVHRKDGTVFTPYNREMAEQYRLQTTGMTGKESREYADAFDSMLRAVHNFQFTVVDEKDDGSTERVAPDLSSQEGMQKLASEHNYDVHVESEEPAVSMTSADLEKFRPGDHFEFQMVDLGLVGADLKMPDERPDPPSEEEMEVKDGEEVDGEDGEELPLGEEDEEGKGDKEEEEEALPPNVRITFAQNNPTTRKFFPINPLALVRSKAECHETYEIMNRVPNLLFSMPVKTPFIAQLLQNKPWPVVDNSTNLLRLYGAVINLLATGLELDVDAGILNRNTFFKYAGKYDLLARKNEQQFFHYSHYRNYVGCEKRNHDYWETFRDPFAKEVFVDESDLRDDNLISGSFDIWFDTVPLEWMTQVFPTMNAARDIMFHWYLRVWRCEYAPSRKDLDRMRDNDANRRSVATGITIRGLDRRVLRYWVLSWCYYEMEFGILLTEHMLLQRVMEMGRAIARRTGNVEHASEPWNHLSLRDERDLFQQFYREVYASTRNVMLHMEVYMLRRGLEGPDILQTHWSFLTSADIDLTVRESRTHEEGGTPVKDHFFPLAPYVSEQIGNRIRFSQYRDVLARRVLMAAVEVEKEEEEEEEGVERQTKYESLDVGLFTMEREATLGDGDSVRTETFTTFDVDKIHRRENDDQPLFGGCEWIEAFKANEGDSFEKASFVQCVECPIPWSPNMCVMRDHWAYLLWSLKTPDAEIEKMAQDTLYGQYERIPDFVSMATKSGDVPEIAALIQGAKEKGRGDNPGFKKPRDTSQTKRSRTSRRRRRGKANRCSKKRTRE